MGQIKNIKLHIVTDIKTIYVFYKLSQWLVWYCVEDCLTTPSPTAEEFPRLLVASLFTFTQRKLVPHPNVETVRRNCVELNQFDQKCWQLFQEQRKLFLELMEDQDVQNVFVRES